MKMVQVHGQLYEPVPHSIDPTFGPHQRRVFDNSVRNKPSERLFLTRLIDTPFRMFRIFVIWSVDVT